VSWHWSAIGTVAILFTWLPLAMLVEALKRRTFQRLLPGDTPAAVAQAMASLSPG
jgi:hypothetical protein